MSWFKFKRNRRDKNEDLNIFLARRREEIRDVVATELKEKYIPKINKGEKVVIDIDEFKKEKFSDVSNSVIMAMILYYIMQHSDLGFNELLECKTIEIWKTKD